MLGSGSKKHIVLLILATILLAVFIILATPARSYIGDAQPVPVPAKNWAHCTSLLDIAPYPADEKRPGLLLAGEPGQVAMLGLILGVRYALGPEEGADKVKVPDDNRSSDISGNRAVKIAQYRACRNDALLRSL